MCILWRPAWRPSDPVPSFTKAGESDNTVLRMWDYSPLVLLGDLWWLALAPEPSSPLCKGTRWWEGRGKVQLQLQGMQWTSASEKLWQKEREEGGENVGPDLLTPQEQRQDTFVLLQRETGLQSSPTVEQQSSVFRKNHHLLKKKKISLS